MSGFFTKKRIMVAGALLFLAILYIILSGRGRESAVNPDIYLVAKGDVVQEIKLSGIIQPLFKEDVASAVQARIKKSLVKDGDLVKKGQLLLEMNEEDLISNLESARSKLLRAKARYEEIKNWQNSQTYVGAKSQAENAQIDYQEKNRTYQQNQELYKAKAISQQDLIRSKLELERARTSLSGAQAAFEDAKQKGNQDALKQTHSDYIIAQIAFRDAQKALTHKDIIAPCSGLIMFKQQTTTATGTVEKSVSENRIVTPGEILMSIGDRDNFTVDGPVDEFDVYKIHLNQPGVVSVPALGGKKFASKIVSISSSKSQKGTFFNIRNLIEKPDPQIKVGLSANVEIPLEERKGVLVVPVSALVKRGDTYGVFLKQDGEVPKYQPVKVGLSNSEVAEITQGLAAGQKILRRVPSRLTGEG
jgi:HlyD family secretion protein